MRAWYGDLGSNFTLDAGLWSKALFLEVDAAGFGLLYALKDNKPDLMAEVERVLAIERKRTLPHAYNDWEPFRGGHIRRRLWRYTRLNGWNGWRHLRQVAVVEQTTRDHDGKETTELRYFVTNATTGMLPASLLLRLIRLHWAIAALSFFGTATETFDLQFGEDAGTWCTQNTAILVLGVLRMIAYNLLQHLRKSHVVVQRETAQPTPRPWRNLFEHIHRCLLHLGTVFGRLFSPTPCVPFRATAVLRASSSA